MDFLSLIILISILAKIFKKNSPEKYEETIRKAKDIGGEVVGELRGNVQSRRMMAEQQKKKYEEKMREYEQMAQRQTQRSTYEVPKQEVKKTTILDRAKENTDAQKEDLTLRSLEESHGHSAHVAPGAVDHVMVTGETKLCYSEHASSFCPTCCYREVPRVHQKQAQPPEVLGLRFQISSFYSSSQHSRSKP